MNANPNKDVIHLTQKQREFVNSFGEVVAIAQFAKIAEHFRKEKIYSHRRFHDYWVSKEAITSELIFPIGMSKKGLRVIKTADIIKFLEETYLVYLRDKKNIS